MEVARARGPPTREERGQGKVVMAEAEVPCRGSGSRAPSWDSCGLLGVHWPCSPGFPPQSSQPSTTSPFKQEVFIYSPSPSGESPSLGAAATPIIMSRSPTGQWHVEVCVMSGGQSCALAAVQRACTPAMLSWLISPFLRC